MTTNLTPPFDDLAALIIPQELPPLENAPRLSAARAPVVRAVTVLDEHGERRMLQIPAERALSVVLNGAPLVTLMTLGAAPEYLVLGFLRNQRIIESATQVRSIDVDWERGVAEVHALPARAGVASARGSSQQQGVACALGTAFDAPLRSVVAARISRTVLLQVLDIMQTHDAIHRAAGSVHSCALFDGAQLLVAIEDVSRHNGVDSVTGWMAQHGVAGAGKILFTTGRLTAEMVLKAAYNGIPILVSRNGMTAMGHELAEQLQMSVFARAAKRRFLCYLGAERFDE